MAATIIRCWLLRRRAARPSPSRRPAKRIAKPQRSPIIRCSLKRSAWDPAGSSALRAGFRSRSKDNASEPSALAAHPRPWTGRLARRESTRLREPDFFLVGRVISSYLNFTVQSSVILSDSEGSQRRSEEHTSELQSPDHLVCRLLL